MEVAKYLDDCPQHQVRVPRTASPTEIEDALHKARRSRKHVSHMLNAVVLAIATKVLWELDNNLECRHTHNIIALYGELDERSQRDIRTIYDEKLAILAGLEGPDKKGQRMRLGDLVKFQSLREAPKANEATMKNFKYDGEFKGKGSAMGGVIWDSKVFWTLPPLNFVRFPEALCEYTADRVQDANGGVNL